MTQIADATYGNKDGSAEANASGVSWAAVIAGAFVTAALYLILLALGSGLGMSSVSVWSNQGISASTLGGAAIAWLIFAEIVSSAMGGYLAGRLRTRWTVLHGDEVYFRDTAHGFLSWSVALVVTAALLGSAATVMIGASPTESTGDKSASRGANAYFVDSMLRSDTPKSDANAEIVHNEVSTILTSALTQGELSGDDRSYLAHLTAARTGLSLSDADQRVSTTYTALKQSAESARKATAHSLLWIFIALLSGAFCASFAGTIGGRQRDKVVLL